MENDLDLGRYAAGLRRHKIAVAIAAIIGLAAGVLFAASSSYSQSVQLLAAPKSAELASVGIDPGQLDIDNVIDALAAELGEATFEDQLGSQVGGEVSVQITRSLDRPAITVVVVATNAERTRQAVDVLVEQARAQFASEVGDDLDRVRIGTIERRSVARSQIAELDGELDAAGSDQQTLVEGLLVERRRVTDLEAGYQALLAALDRFEAGIRLDLEATTSGQPEALSPIMFGVLGSVGGASFGAGLALLAVAIDRSVRTRRDLARLGLDDLVAVVPDPPDDRSLAIGHHAIAALAATLGSNAVQIVPLADVVDVLAPLARAGQIDVAIRPPISGSVDAIEHASDGVTVLAVRWGADRRADVVRAANEISGAGAKHVAVLLWSVPPKETSAIER